MEAEKADVELGTTSPEGSSHLNRNRSFKSKQLVRSLAIRESTSPPRTISPAVTSDIDSKETNSDVKSSNSDNNIETVTSDNDARIVTEQKSDESSHVSDDRCSDVISFSDNVGDDNNKRKQAVEIQITTGWDSEPHSEQRQRTKRWLGHKQHSDSSDLLSNNPRIMCVCGTCKCPQCRGRRRRHLCPTKQDSGIVCSDDCPDCADSDHTGGSMEVRKSGSLEVDDAPYFCRCPIKPKTISISRTDSEEKTEPTGVDLVNFIKETLNKNPRDRMTLLKIEKELHSLINDTGRCIVRFPVMTSYGRMLVHRCAALFQLSHHLDHTNKNSVLVSKSGTSGGRLPCTSFKEWCTTIFPPSPHRQQSDTTHAKSILKREAGSEDGSNGKAGGAARSKSLEQREREYERVRRRIFSTDNCTQDESQWPWLNSGPVKLLTPDAAGKNKLLKVQSLESSAGPPQSCRDRGPVCKSHSFGGYGEPPSSHGQSQNQPRLLSRQGDLASSSWRLSPSSSGYKTLSLRSTDSVTPSPTGGASPEPICAERGVVWAVTDMSAVPPGAVVIHPQTGRPLTNPDGSIYHFDPSNPPQLYDTGSYYQKNEQNEKRRGKLEKQHSFIDNAESECDCQPSEECGNNCCCEYRQKNGACQPNTVTEKVTQQEEKSIHVPTSPRKNRYDPEKTLQENNTNQQTYYENATNQRLSLGPLPNQRSFETQKYESSQRSFESTSHHRPVYERQKPQYEVPTNQSPARPKLSSQESQDMTQYMVPQAYFYRTEETTSPSQPIPGQPYMHHEMVNLQNMTVQTKLTPVPHPDPHLRQMSLANMMYPNPMPQAYPYINQCRMEPQLQPMYQPVLPQQEEPKQLAPSPHTNDTTFRIDPSYPYPMVDCGACATQCVAPPTMHHHQRSYNMPLMPAEAGVPQMPNIMLPQPMPHYQYQDPMQWTSLPTAMMPMPPPATKLLVHELHPVVCPNMYPHFNYVTYPPVLPQPFPICQPVYPLGDKPPSRNSVHRQSKRESISSSPAQTPPVDKRQDSASNSGPGPEMRVPYDDKQNLSRQNSADIASKIQQIKDQMAQMSVQRENKKKEENWKRRNSGSGILGSYPVANYNGRIQGRTQVNDDSQLNSAARAIVQSIRNMQTKNNNYQQDNRRPHEYHNQNQAATQKPEQRQDKPDFRRQRQEREEKQNGANNIRSPPAVEDTRQLNRAINQQHLQYTPPYLIRQMSPGNWCRRSPGPVHPMLNNPRRPHPDNRNIQRR